MKRQGRNKKLNIRIIDISFFSVLFHTLCSPLNSALLYFTLRHSPCYDPYSVPLFCHFNSIEFIQPNVLVASHSQSGRFVLHSSVLVMFRSTPAVFFSLIFFPIQFGKHFLRCCSCLSFSSKSNFFFSCALVYSLPFW